MDDGAGGSSLLASGREADVYRFGERRVRRRYKDGSSPAGEVDLMRYVAGYGYPVPAVHSVDRVDLIMDLVEGPTMAEAVQSGALDVIEAARHLADLHDWLHALPPPSGAGAGHCIVHLDLHPLNVLMSEHGPVVIDWRYGRPGPRDLDLAMTAVILAEGGSNSSDPRHVLLRTFLGEFLATVAGDAGARLDEAVKRRGVDFPDPRSRQRHRSAAYLVREVLARGQASVRGGERPDHAARVASDAADQAGRE